MFPYTIYIHITHKKDFGTANPNYVKCIFWLDHIFQLVFYKWEHLGEIYWSDQIIQVALHILKVVI